MAPAEPSPGRAQRRIAPWSGLAIVSLVAAASAVLHAPDSRLSELQRRRSLAAARESVRAWVGSELARARPFAVCQGSEHFAGDDGSLTWSTNTLPHGLELHVRFAQRGSEHEFRGELVRGALPECFAASFGMVAPLPPDLELECGGALELWSEVPAALAGGVRAGPFDLELGSQLLSSPTCAFARADELPLRHFGRPTLGPDYALSLEPYSARAALEPIASDERELAVHVPGNLWLGHPERRLVLDLRGRTLLLHVSGHVFVRGEIELHGACDRLVVFCGQHVEDAAPGRIELGVPGGPEPLGIEACFAGAGELVLRASRIELRGQLLCAGPVRSVAAGSRLRIERPAAGGDLLRPLRGLPCAPGTEDRLRLVSLEAKGPVGLRH